MIFSFFWFSASLMSAGAPCCLCPPQKEKKEVFHFRDRDELETHNPISSLEIWVGCVLMVFLFVRSDVAQKLIPPSSHKKNILVKRKRCWKKKKKKVPGQIKNKEVSVQRKGRCFWSRSGCHLEGLSDWPAGCFQGSSESDKRTKGFH